MQLHIFHKISEIMSLQICVSSDKVYAPLDLSLINGPIHDLPEMQLLGNLTLYLLELNVIII